MRLMVLRTLPDSSGFQPSLVLDVLTWGIAPGCNEIAPLALKGLRVTNGTLILGHCARFRLLPRHNQNLPITLALSCFRHRLLDFADVIGRLNRRV